MMRKTNTKALLTLREASQRLGISSRTLQRLIANQLIRYYRIGSLKIMFSERQLTDYLTRVEQPTDGVKGDAN
jgi:excisionase family DNA binding protein